jgi:predicted DsbA family dithiol-disulfide isomerase
VSIDKLKENYPVQTRWIHFPLHPETPVEGQSLAELFAGRDISEVKKRLQDLMAEAGLPYGNRTHTFNSRLAQELGKWADTQEGADKIHDLLYRAYFVDNVNIGDVDELVKIAAAAGLDEDAARQVIVERQFEAQVDEDWKRSRAIGVTGVPKWLLWVVSLMMFWKSLLSIFCLNNKQLRKTQPSNSREISNHGKPHCINYLCQPLYGRRD